MPSAALPLSDKQMMLQGYRVHTALFKYHNNHTLLPCGIVITVCVAELKWRQIENPIHHIGKTVPSIVDGYWFKFKLKHITNAACTSSSFISWLWSLLFFSRPTTPVLSCLNEVIHNIAFTKSTHMFPYETITALTRYISVLCSMSVRGNADVGGLAQTFTLGDTDAVTLAVNCLHSWFNCGTWRPNGSGSYMCFQRWDLDLYLSWDHSRSGNRPSVLHRPSQ